jgi:hypothetical protein
VLTAQKLEENGIASNPHPAFSLDLSPFDFFLFGALRDQLVGCNFEPADEVVGEIYEMAQNFPNLEFRSRSAGIRMNFSS